MPLLDSSTHKVSNTQFLANIAKWYWMFLIQDLYRTFVFILFSVELGAGIEILLVPQMIICMLLPFVVFMVSIDMGWDHYRHAQDSKCCRFLWFLIVSPILAIIGFILMVVAIPNTASIVAYIFPWKPCIWDLFYSSKSRNIRKLLRYILNHDDSKEIKKRILACNYFILTTTNNISNRGEIIQKYQELHNNSNMSKMSWSVVRELAQSPPDESKFVVPMLGLFIWNFLIITGIFVVQYEQLSDTAQFCGSIYVILEIIFYVLEWKLFWQLYYCYHISGRILQLDDMDIYDIQRIYEIMHSCPPEIQNTIEKCTNLHPDLANLIVSFLKEELPGGLNHCFNDSFSFF